MLLITIIIIPCFTSYVLYIDVCMCVYIMLTVNIQATDVLAQNWLRSVFCNTVLNTDIIQLIYDK